MEDANKFVSFMNSISRDPDLRLNSVLLTFKNHKTNDNFSVELMLDPDLGRLEATVDPDYDLDSRYDDDNELIMVGNPNGFDIDFEAKCCTAWRLCSLMGTSYKVPNKSLNELWNQNPVQTLEDD